jgi:Protein of unknown function (DUF2934)
MPPIVVVRELLTEVQVARTDLRYLNQLVPISHRIIDPVIEAKEDIMSDTLSAAFIATSQDEKIRQRAYEIWENEGRTGNPEDHWFRAQQELDDQGQERSDATVEDAPPAAAAEASSAATGEVPDQRFAG